MICYVDGGHYLAFFRRMILKVEYLIDVQNYESNLRKLQREVDSNKEWVEYNDTRIRYHTKNWPGVIEYCIENNMYPTLLFFEKLS